MSWITFLNPRLTAKILIDDRVKCQSIQDRYLILRSCDQEFLKISPLLVVDKGRLCDYQELKDDFSMMMFGGLYMWLVKPPRARKWIAVYIGKSKQLGKRVHNYVHPGTKAGVKGWWGPSSEEEKQQRMFDLQRRGFSVQLMWAGVCWVLILLSMNLTDNK